MQSLDDELILRNLPRRCADLPAVTVLSHFPAGSSILSKFLLLFILSSNDSSCGMNQGFTGYRSLFIIINLIIGDFRLAASGRWLPGKRFTQFLQRE